MPNDGETSYRFSRSSLQRQEDHKCHMEQNIILVGGSCSYRMQQKGLTAVVTEYGTMLWISDERTLGNEPETRRLLNRMCDYIGAPAAQRASKLDPSGDSCVGEGTSFSLCPSKFSAAAPTTKDKLTRVK